MITFWLHAESGLLISVHETRNGLDCNCMCPKCWVKLIKKWHWESRVQWKRRAHFAHYTEIECEWAYESTIHKLAKQIISNDKELFLPSYTSNEWFFWRGSLSAKRVIFTKWVRIEENQSLLDRRPDAIWVLENGAEIWIEFAYSHFISWEKLRIIIQNWIECIEVDLRWIEMDELRSFLIEQSSWRKWINHPSGEVELQRTMSEQANEQNKLRKMYELERSKKVLIQKYINKGYEVSEDISKAMWEHYKERSSQFEKEWRPPPLSMKPWENKPYNCPRKDKSYAVWCKNCEFNIAIYRDHKGYSEIMCAYWAKKIASKSLGL